MRKGKKQINFLESYNTKFQFHKKVNARLTREKSKMLSFHYYPVVQSSKKPTENSFFSNSHPIRKIKDADPPDRDTLPKISEKKFQNLSILANAKFEETNEEKLILRSKSKMLRKSWTLWGG